MEGRFWALTSIRNEFIAAFKEFIGNENFEERADPNAQWIDRPVFRYLVQKFEK